MANASVKTRVLWAALAVLTLSAGMAVMSAAFPATLRVGDQAIGTAIATVIYALLALVSGLVISKRRRIGWWSLGFLALSLGSWIVYIWDESSWQYEQTYQRVIGSLGVPAGVSLQLGVLMLPTIRATHWRVLRIIVGGCSVVAGLLLLLMIGIDGVNYLWGAVGPIIGALVLLTLFGTVMVVVVSSIEKSAAADEHEVDIEHRTPVTVTCPRCQESTSIRSNTDSACESCGMRIRVNITEPRCDCGYLLYNLPGEVCPECGKPIPSEHRRHMRDGAAQSSGQRP